MVSSVKGATLLESWTNGDLSAVLNCGRDSLRMLKTARRCELVLKSISSFICYTMTMTSNQVTNTSVCIQTKLAADKYWVRIQFRHEIVIIIVMQNHIYINQLTLLDLHHM